MTGGELVSRLVQKTFKPHGFDGSGLNLHVRDERRSKELVIFVHGLNGQGYNTWRGLPQIIFDGEGRNGCDVAIFDYPSGLRALFKPAGDLEFFVSQLAEQLDILEKVYSDIYLVGHSLGGLIISASAKRYLERRLSANVPLTPLAALVFFSSPRAGSAWAKSYLRPFFREFRWLHRFSRPAREVVQFFEDNVESHAVATSGHRHFLLPKFSRIASNDIFVQKMSATFDIPTAQQNHVDGSHSSHLGEGAPWLNEEVRSPVRDLRAQWRRENSQAASIRSMKRLGRQPFIVTELQGGRRELAWEEIYNEARRSATLTSSIEVRDRRDHDCSATDLLISVHKDKVVLSPESPSKEDITDAYNAHCSNDRLTVGVTPVGEKCDDAKVRIEEWIPSTKGAFYVSGSQNLDDLQDLMTRWIQVVLDRDPRRRSRENSRAGRRLQLERDPFDLPGRPDYR